MTDCGHGPVVPAGRQNRTPNLKFAVQPPITAAALAALFNILFAGVTFILYGLAVAWSRRYPRWLGWVVVARGDGARARALLPALALLLAVSAAPPGAARPDRRRTTDPGRHRVVPRPDEARAVTATATHTTLLYDGDRHYATEAGGFLRSAVPSIQR